MNAQSNSRNRDLYFLLLLWVVASALNIGKAFHVDDTFHLMAAQWVELHPLRPLSGPINWGYGPQPLSGGNQPPGFFYLVAATGHLFGYTEWPMHAMVSVFTLIALFNFHRLTQYFAPGAEKVATVLFALCPAFLVNQNVMADMPLLALQVLAFRLLLVPGEMAVGWRYLFAALALSAAMFIKYSTLPLLLVFPLVLMLRREWRWLPMALVPVALLSVWSIWNMNEFGFVHLLDRTGGDPSLRGLYVRTLSVFTCLGAVAPFTPVFTRVLAARAGKWLFRTWLAMIASGIGLMAAAWFRWLPETVTDEVLRIAFTLNGVYFLLLLVLVIPRSFAPGRADQWALTAWCLSLLLFMALFAPGMATRYVLLFLPPLLLLLAPALCSAQRKEQMLAVACTAVLGIALSAGDREYAGWYRDMAPRLMHDVAGPRTVWSIGHWGWQWYAQQAGMHTYALHGDQPRPGDLVVVPEAYAAQAMDERLLGVPVRTYTAPAGLGTFFNVDGFASLYSSSYGDLPWTFSRSRRKTIEVFRVVAHGGGPIKQHDPGFEPSR